MEKEITELQGKLNNMLRIQFEGKPLSQNTLDSVCNTILNYTLSLVQDEDYNEFIDMDIDYMDDSLQISPLNFFTAMLLHGYYFPEAITDDLKQCEIVGAGRFKWEEDKLLFQPYTPVKSVEINFTID